MLGRPHSAYPVEGRAGRIEGLVTLRQLRAVTPQDRARTRVADIALPLDKVPTATPTEPLVSVLERRDGHDASVGDRILVFDNGELVGIVTPADISRAIDARTLKDGSAQPSAPR